MEEKVELLACPFCGGEATTEAQYRAYSIDSSFTAVGCTKCGAYGMIWDDQQELEFAIKHWNTRAEVANEKL